MYQMQKKLLKKSKLEEWTMDTKEKIDNLNIKKVKKKRNN